MFCKAFYLIYMVIIDHFGVFLSSVPELDRCQIYDPDLVDPLLKQTYKNIPKLPR
jgi:hypothetical protein